MKCDMYEKNYYQNIAFPKNKELLRYYIGNKMNV